MNCVGYQLLGLWVYFWDCFWQYKDLEYWVDLVWLLECGKFDGLFIVDVLGIYDVLNGSGDVVICQVMQVLVNDLLVLIILMVLVMEYLGFGLIVLLLFEYFYFFVCCLFMFDYLIKGWVGWNIVIFYLESGVCNIGQQIQIDYDICYDYVDEYLQVIYKLLEGSWEDGVVLCDREWKIFSDLWKIYFINYQGQFFFVLGIYFCELFLQCMLVLYQVGVFSCGKQFVVGYVECVFVVVLLKVLLKKMVVDICCWVVEVGCDLYSILIFNLQMVIVGDIDCEVQVKWQEYKQYVSYEGVLVLFFGWMGIDFGQYQLDQVLKYLYINVIQLVVEVFLIVDLNCQWMVQVLVDWVGIGGFGLLVVGSV